MVQFDSRSSLETVGSDSSDPEKGLINQAPTNPYLAGRLVVALKAPFMKMHHYRESSSADFEGT